MTRKGVLTLFSLFCLVARLHGQGNYYQLELIGRNDDCYEKDGLIIHNTVYLDMGFQSVAGFRFQLNTEKDYIIDSARLVLVYHWGFGPATFRITLEDTVDAQPFGDLASRKRMDSSVIWAIDETRSSYGTTFFSPDLAPLINELIDYRGWVSGNHIAVILQSLVPAPTYLFEVVSY